MSDNGQGAMVLDGPGLVTAASTLARTFVSMVNPILARSVAYPMDGHNAKKFVKEYESLFETEFATPASLCRNLRHSVPSRHMAVIEEWEEFKKDDWEGVKERMDRDFGNGDEEESPDRLYDIVDRQKEARNKIRSRQDLYDYYRRFKRHSEQLVAKELLSWQGESALFLEGLPQELVKEYAALRDLSRSLLDSVEHRVRSKQAGSKEALSSSELAVIRKQYKEEEREFRRELRVAELKGEIAKLLRDTGRSTHRYKDSGRGDFYNSDSEDGEEDRGSYGRRVRSPSPALRGVRFSGLPLSFLRRQESVSVPSTATRSALSSRSRSGNGLVDEEASKDSGSTGLPHDFLDDFRRLVVNSTVMGEELMSMKQEFGRMQSQGVQMGSYYGGNVNGSQQQGYQQQQPYQSQGYGPLPHMRSQAQQGFQPRAQFRGQPGFQGQGSGPRMQFGQGGQGGQAQAQNRGFGTGANAIQSPSICLGCGLSGHVIRYCSKILDRKTKGDVTENSLGRFFFRGRESPWPNDLPPGMPNYDALWSAWERGSVGATVGGTTGAGGTGQEGQGVGIMRSNVAVFTSADKSDAENYDVNVATRSQTRARMAGTPNEEAANKRTAEKMAKKAPALGTPRVVTIDPVARPMGGVEVKEEEVFPRGAMDEEMTDISGVTNATSTTRRKAAQSVLRAPVNQRFSFPDALKHVLNDAKADRYIANEGGYKAPILKGLLFDLEERVSDYGGKIEGCKNVYAQQEEEVCFTRTGQDMYNTRASGYETSGIVSSFRNRQLYVYAGQGDGVVRRRSEGIESGIKGETEDLDGASSNLSLGSSGEDGVKQGELQGSEDAGKLGTRGVYRVLGEVGILFGDVGTSGGDHSERVQEDLDGGTKALHLGGKDLLARPVGEQGVVILAERQEGLLRQLQDESGHWGGDKDIDNDKRAQGEDKANSGESEEAPVEDQAEARGIAEWQPNGEEEWSEVSDNKDEGEINQRTRRRQLEREEERLGQEMRTLTPERDRREHRPTSARNATPEPANVRPAGERWARGYGDGYEVVQRTTEKETDLSQQWDVRPGQRRKLQGLV